MKAKNIEEFFGTLQQATVEAWKEHLKTDKYSSHIALNEFYDDIVELVDTLIENYMGKHGKVGDYKNIMSTDKMGAIEYLEQLRELTVEGRAEFFKEDEPELQSDCDSILSLIDSTLYKLKELKEGMKPLVDFLKESLEEVNESINFSDAEKAVFDFLQSEAKKNHYNIDEDKLRDLANTVVDWYDNEDALDDFRNVKSFINFLKNDIYEMLDAADDADVRDTILKILGED